MIALFGGTFDPVHLGHVHAARQAAARLNCPLRLVLAATPTHRRAPGASALHRWNMLQLACEDEPQIVPDAMELLRGGASFTVDTLQALRTALPEEPLFWVLGTDAFNDVKHWRDWRHLLQLAHLLLLTRPGATLQADVQRLVTDRRRQDLAGEPAGGICLVEDAMLAISASDVRRRIASGNLASASNLLPGPVRRYIEQHGLYRAGG